MAITVLDAPTNLGLRPPAPGFEPGCAKAPAALRGAGLLGRLAAHDAGELTAPRYDVSGWQPGDGVRQAAAINAYSQQLAQRLDKLLDHTFPLVLGGDCSILLGTGRALRHRAERENRRYGLAFLDGHSDFRHPGNSTAIGSAAGEDLALATGRGQADVACRLFEDADVVVLGIREEDEDRAELSGLGIAHRTAAGIREAGAAESAEWARRRLDELDGFWVHLDVDILDPSVMPAVDAPDPGGLEHAELAELLTGLTVAPGCMGVEVTVFDPDLDPHGQYAAALVDTLARGLAPRVA
ncbi:arginase family protein [Kutzneria viridogrisea]|uniref:Arginase/agmatinase/formimino glutamase n=2 Tax=Kutzneria TaxID=43356 RepID=W5VYJ4_9PSEU|nr:arginase family protein [Kutzneria albida]AHH93988.1 Arginase/agmatinase/formimino glutamase [Kutzneria albida DSM 43870]MBA8931007.1 arginase [Kutzneria viridogrisea]